MKLPSRYTVTLIARIKTLMKAFYNYLAFLTANG
jgi:hypothetical protein